MLNFKSTSFGDFAFTTCRFGEDILTVVAGNHRLGMAEHNICLTAASAFDIHKIRVWSWDKTFKFMLLSLLFMGGVEKVSVHIK